MRKKIIAGLVIVFAIFYVFHVTTKCEVIEVKDGDSIVVSYGMQVRLAHIDCPEWDQPWGDKATERVKELALGKQVRVKRLTKDLYGRTVAEVTLPDGRILNHLLVQEGLAWHYRRYSSDRYYQQLELEARAKRRGLWSDSHTIAPWIWRRR